jgi:hypothetical protein
MAPEQEGDDEQGGDRDVQQDAVEHDQPDLSAGERAVVDAVHQHENGERQQQHDGGDQARIVDAQPDAGDDVDDAVDERQPDPGEAEPAQAVRKDDGERDRHT